MNILLYTHRPFRSSSTHKYFIGVSLNDAFLVTIITAKKEKKTAWYTCIRQYDPLHNCTVKLYTQNCKLNTVKYSYGFFRLQKPRNL